MFVGVFDMLRTKMHATLDRKKDIGRNVVNIWVRHVDGWNEGKRQH